TGVIGTLGYRWADKQRDASRTTPESLDLQHLFHEMVADRVTHAVMEVSSHALSMERVGNCAFDAAVFTNLSQDHLDFHASMEDYFQAKERLFKNHLDRHEKQTVSVVNMDDPYGRRLATKVSKNLWTYSTSSREARVWVKHAELSGTGIGATLSGPMGDLTVQSPLLGRLNLYNVLAAATTAMSLGVSREAIADGLRSVSQVDGRLQRVRIPGWCGFDVVVDYAHTPDAMEKSLDCLREMTKGRLLVVFGCGGDRDRTKRPIMGGVAARRGDVVIVTSDNPRTEIPEAIVREIEPGIIGEAVRHVEADEESPPEKGYTIEVDRRRAIELALAWARPGDMVFIGGKGHETYQIVGARTFPFDDRLVVKEYFEKLESMGHSPPGRS
ncbi:MAG: UDP-N-acetylmuramoyl-L-alanyl-D-glutamate--2,6-diaminopimelate ligase, partial [Syntrophobacteraceae bacterium]|nr:UDP-N-acetylmuramoyl-L-alanyl-D-glutamate--2,6-diaminopimelate ligase [Syntrophobacteraceae bacterium]